MATYIPDPEQEEESLITAKIESEIEKLKKRMDEYMFVYVNDEKNINYKVQIESSMKSWSSSYILPSDKIYLVSLSIDLGGALNFMC